MPRHLQPPGIDVRIGADEIEEVGMQPRREPRRVVVPVEHIKGRRRISKQIVVHPVVPDQVVRPHPGEHACQFLSFDNAGETRGTLGGNDRFRRNEHAGRRILRHRHVEHAHRHGGAVNLGFAARSKVREEGRRDDAAGARAPDVDVCTARHIADDVHGLLHRPDIGVEPELALGGSRVLPADGEGLQIAVQGEFE